MVRPVKSFDDLLNAVVMELQRTPGATAKLTLEIEAMAPNGFSNADVRVVRDNAQQLKFNAESTPRAGVAESTIKRMELDEGLPIARGGESSGESVQAPPAPSIKPSNKTNPRPSGRRRKR
jgi:hypothetical protein